MPRDTDQQLIVADLTGRHLNHMIRIQSEDGRFVVSGLLVEVRHHEHTTLWIQIGPGNTIDVTYDRDVVASLLGDPQ